jgi:UDP-glucose 4-epimerase
MTRLFFVTGAAGCVGFALMERLAAIGMATIGVDLSPRPMGCPDQVSWIRGDILDVASYEEALHGVDTVVHLAAKVHAVPKTLEDAASFFRVNVEGTRNVLGAAVRMGVRKFLFVSTVAVLAPPVKNASGSYAASKRDAESAVLSGADRLEVVIVRPATVYGPRDRGNVCRLIRWIDRGFPPVAGPGTNRKSMVSVRNLVEAILFLADRGENGKAYIVTDGRDLSVNEIAAAIAKFLGRRNRWPAIPLDLLKILAGVNEWLAKRSGVPQFLRREDVEKLAEETTYDSSDLFSLGFSPATDVEAGIAEAVEWYSRSVR